LAKYTGAVDHRTDPTEQRVAEKHRRIAARIRREPRVIAESRMRLTRLIASEPRPSDPVLQEWLDLFLMATPDQSRRFHRQRNAPRAASPDLQPAALA
jgi:hypothetical protein